MIEAIRQALRSRNLLRAEYALEGLKDWQGGVQTDHRLLKQGDIFVCIKGEHFDGHSVSEEALKQGASVIVCETKPSEAYPAF